MSVYFVFVIVQILPLFLFGMCQSGVNEIHLFPVRRVEKGRTSCLITNKNLPGVSTQGADVAEVTEPKQLIFTVAVTST